MKAVITINFEEYLVADVRKALALVMKLKTESSFGPRLNFTGLIPADCDCVMVLINTGGGINAGTPQPVGFLRLTGQIYVRDVEDLIEHYERQQDTAQRAFSQVPLRWITICPVRAKDYLNIWEAAA